MGGLPYLLNKFLQKYYYKVNEYHSTYLHKKSQFEILPKSESAIIFLGDSLTEECQWAELLENPQIKNRGISGDTTERILYRLNAIVESKPRKIFFMIGINDLVNEGKSVEKTLAGYENILTRFSNEIPNTKVFIQSVLPVNNKFRYWQNNNNILQMNQKLKELAQKFNYEYIDVFSLLLDSQNQLDAKYTLDGLHLNGQGYLVWKQAIEKYVID
ncbi:GDSL-type esterase/lipase family protein [Iningainema tapete]